MMDGYKITDLPPELAARTTVHPATGGQRVSEKLPRRPRRRMPDLYRVALYWSQWPEFFELDLDAPECFRCAIVVAADETKTQRELWREASHYLHRAHLADRYHGGLDGPQNLIALCAECHRYMPSFDNGDHAIRWVWKLWRPDWDTRPIPQRIIRDPEAEAAAEDVPLVFDAAGQGALF